ncbi:hypothetical protein [Sediminibacterium sp.]|uniref:hypothetical protein n=1 Tax=Sediminibacterium sp. TaxID=1917865 RepID=UPI0027346DDF|nr:hypothetical protein [Sediminibacterium sp.]MDP3567488.1 hypothetical protein [Sediminibacterium sp.]
MKSLISFCGCVLISLTTNAQQTITGTSQIGYTVQYAAATAATASMVPINTTGANVTWNCSALQNAGQIFTLSINSPSAQSFFNDYPSSNYNLTASASSNTLVNDFFISNTDSLVLLGGRVVGQPYEVYFNPQLVLKFPFSFGNSTIDNYSKTSYASNGNPTSSQTGSITLSYEGYGTLILPSATYSNVAMLKRIRTNSIGPTTTSYSFLKIPSGERLLEYDNNGSVKVNYANSIVTSLVENYSLNDYVIYPTITETSFFIKSDITIDSVKMLNTSGQLIPLNINIAVDGLLSASFATNPGLYIIEISSNALKNHVYKKVLIK